MLPKKIDIKFRSARPINVLKEQIEEVTSEINALVESDLLLNEKKKLLKTIPGIGDIIANELLILMPELGALTRRKIASLAGLAPRANDSGLFSGYRSVNHGRSGALSRVFPYYAALIRATISFLFLK